MYEFTLAKMCYDFMTNNYIERREKHVLRNCRQRVTPIEI